MRIALYARVSTNNGNQDVENQLSQLREYCSRAGWTIVHEYIDRASGKSGERDSLKRMMADAAKRQFDVLLVWALDRLTRQGVLETFEYIRDLRAYGVEFESYTEPHFRTTGPAGELMLAVAAWIAKQERQRISDRVKAGLEKAKRSGKKLGRRFSVIDRSKVLAMHDAGLSLSQIVSELGTSRSTIARVIRRAASN